MFMSCRIVLSARFVLFPEPLLYTVQCKVVYFLILRTQNFALTTYIHAVLNCAARGTIL